MSEAVPGNMDDYDAKSQQRNVVLMFKALVDRQKHFALPLQLLHQDVVGKASPSQLQDGRNGMFLFQETFDARVHAFIEDDPHRLPGGERLNQALLGQGEKARRLLALDAGEIGEKGVDRVAFRDVIEKSLDGHTGAGKARGAVHDVRIDPDDFIKAQVMDDAHFLIRIRRRGRLLQARRPGRTVSAATSSRVVDCMPPIVGCD